MRKVSKDYYCSKICKAKCCYFTSKEEGIVKCPNLKDDASCGVYEKRYAEGTPDIVVVGRYRSKVVKDLDGNLADRPFFCGKISNLLRDNMIAKEIVAQCCYAHPELLEIAD